MAVPILAVHGRHAETTVVGFWPARYRADDRVSRVALANYRTNRDAEALLAATRVDVERRTRPPPEQGRNPLWQNADKWLEQKRPPLHLSDQ